MLVLCVCGVRYKKLVGPHASVSTTLYWAAEIPGEKPLYPREVKKGPCRHNQPVLAGSWGWGVTKMLEENPQPKMLYLAKPKLSEAEVRYF